MPAQLMVWFELAEPVIFGNGNEELGLRSDVTTGLHPGQQRNRKQSGIYLFDCLARFGLKNITYYSFAAYVVKHAVAKRGECSVQLLDDPTSAVGRGEGK